MNQRCSTRFAHLLAFFCMAPLSAQNTAPGGQDKIPVYQANARSVVVDVVVTKGNDEPVLGLTRQDFEVSEDGKPQLVDFFEAHTAKTIRPKAQSEMPPMLPGTYTNVPPTAESDSVNVLLLDSLNTPQQDQAYVHRQIMDFLTKMQPGTRVAIFTLGSRLRFVQDFTTDTSALLAALDDKRNGTVTKNEAGSPDRGDEAADAADVERLQAMRASPAALSAIAESQADMRAFDYATRASMTLEALNNLARYLAGVPGRKNLIWFSSSFPVSIFPTAGQRADTEKSAALGGYLNQAKQTADLLTVSKVAVYPIGAKGMMVEHVMDSENAGPGSLEGPGHTQNPMVPYKADAEERAANIAAMEQLAAETGGKAFFNTNDLNGAMQAAINDGANYYTLGYTPTNDKLDGMYRRIEVRLSRNHYKLAYRRGYNADKPSMAVMHPAADPLRPLLEFGLPNATGLLYGVRAVAESPQPASDAQRAEQNSSLKGPTIRYSVDFVIRPADVALDPVPQDRHIGKIQVDLKAYDRNGNAINWQGGTQTMDMDSATYNATQKTGIPAHLEIDLPNENVTLVTGVYDWGSGNAGTLEIPLHRTLTAIAASVPSPLKMQVEPQPSTGAGNGSPIALPLSPPEKTSGSIKLDVVVTDKAGKLVSGLGHNDFRLLDNNQPTTIQSFQSFGGSADEQSPPIEITLVVDTLSVGFSNVSLERQQVENFLRRNGGHLAQPVSILLFTNDGATVVSEASLDGNAMAAALEKSDSSLRDRKTLTSLGTASVLTAAGINWDQAGKPGRKLLIWIGRSWPMPAYRTTSQDRQAIFKDIVEFSTLLRQTHTTLDNILLGDLDSHWYEDFLTGVKYPNEADRANISLQVVAVQSGGRVLGPNYDLASLIESCIADSKAFYSIAFAPTRPEHANEFHELKVQVAKLGMKARTNTGYYNQPSLAFQYQEAGLPKPPPNVPQGREQAQGKSVTVHQLEDLLAAARDKPDAETARQLSNLVLTQQLSSIGLSSWKARLPGAKARQALIAVADASAFLDLPPSESLSLTPPDLPAQRLMLAHTVDYLKKTIPELPNLFATRTTVLYELPVQEGLDRENGQSWRAVATSDATVLYRDGKEVVENEKSKMGKAKENDLFTTGTFGPILYTVVMDAARSKLTWSHWEQGTAGPEAVFSFAVPIEKSGYEVEYPSPLDEGQLLHHRSGYHGEFAIDPDTGAILCLKVEADPPHSIPIVQADIMVEYGPVEIGGKPYICPVRSVSTSRMNLTLGPDLTRMSDVAFAEYHVFRATSNILPGDQTAPDEK